ncbi:LamG-like jellyroll fold domain-containing protein [Halobacterium rubrum]|uniref:LamG-like jellyroll fold domain-containing protein n=1 Tax=Halobacterium TaxID=2239 RepID=UPI001F21DD69|nr:MULTISPECIES: LamG-like jellyroll fold domain-containing protein [Halobacterium]MDH5018896.1 hypothetical protein [Halobacterium rubrum]
MKRRQLLLGVASVAGAGGLLGPGAFTSVQADRSVNVEVADDANAFLAMEPMNTPNGDEYASVTADGLVTVDLTETDAGGDGLGVDSTYTFDDVLQVTNQGTQPVYVWATFAGGGDLGNDDIWLYPDSDPSTKLNDGSNSVAYLPVGESLAVGVRVNTDGLDAAYDRDLTATINANVDDQGSKPSDPGGDPIDGPVDGLVSYWRLNDLDGSGTGTTIDAVGSYDGTVEGPVGVADGVEGGGAAEFDGDNDVISTDLNIGAAGESVTVAGWLKAPSGQGIGNNHFFLSNYIDQGHDGFFAIGSNDGQEMFFWTRDPSTQTSKKTGRTDAAFDGDWHHYVGVRDAENEEIRFYVDGSFVDSKSFPGDVAIRDSDSTFGLMQHYDNRYLERYVDAVRVYDRALTGSEVQTLCDVHAPSAE